jgi:hypothetical protein
MHSDYIQGSNRSYALYWERPYHLVDKKLGPHSKTTYKVSAPYRALGVVFDTRNPFTNGPVISIYLWHWMASMQLRPFTFNPAWL